MSSKYCHNRIYDCHDYNRCSNCHYYYSNNEVKIKRAGGDE